MSHDHPLLPAVFELHQRIRAAVIEACVRSEAATLSEVAAEDADGDTIYAIDRIAEHVLIESLEPAAAAHGPIRLVAEGLPSNGTVLPQGADPTAVRWRVIVDPIDGTRGLMYQKRPAWIITGIAPEQGPTTGIEDLVVSVMTELPLRKQGAADRWWAVRGGGVHGRRCLLATGVETVLHAQPSRCADLRHGFAQISRFFPGGRDLLAALDDELLTCVEGPPPAGRALCFEDQYLSTAGQLIELMIGHDRFCADLRPLLRGPLAGRGQPAPMCCHPYDIAGLVIAREAGVIVTAPGGGPINAPLDCVADVAWCGYANAVLHRRIAPQLDRLLRERGWR